MSTQSSMNHDLKKGDKIEVLGSANEDVWFPATILDSPTPSGALHVKFNTLFAERDSKRKRKKLREYINISDGVTRPVPPAQPHRCFEVGEAVEVLYKKGWRRGEVKEVLDHSMYWVVIVIGGGTLDVVVENRYVRIQDHGSRLHSTLEENSTHELTLQSKKRTKLRIKFTTHDLKPNTFQKGARVEVRSNEEGYHGARYVATVVGAVGQDKVQVQYDTLTTDDQMQPLVEMSCVSDIMPIPPVTSREHPFNMLQEVDAWYHDGWWMGVVTKVLTKLKYVVYFWTTNEELEFQHSILRSHQEYINGKWVESFLRDENPRLEKMKLQTGGRTSMVDLLSGLKVEIAHGAGSFLSTWYPAVILGPVSKRKYLVEYRTLKTHNGPELVEEEVDVSCIRPSPPINQLARQFQPSDAVDAWDVNGWRIGQIHTTMKDFKYEVYFWATDSVVEFQHAYLRPHQDFINGVWLGSYNK